jgi:transketolase
MESENLRLQELKRLANNTRRLILETAFAAQKGSIGGSLSVAEILVTLYFQILRIAPSDPAWNLRDRFILSKGHAALALYSVMALRGFLPEEELKTYAAPGSRLALYPDIRTLPGIEMTTSQLGMGMSAGVGMAIGARIHKKDCRVYVLIGDGECQAGQIWEAALTASKYRLDNLVGLLDYNRLQQYGWPGRRGYASTDRLPPLDNPRAAWESFGWYVLEIDGHRFPDLLSAFATARQVRGRPTLIVARTVKGKGVSFMENDYRWHLAKLAEEQMTAAMAELDTEAEEL